MREETAVVLVAGEGTRLHPHTLERPKCLLDVGGKTLLDRTLDALSACEIERVVLVVGYRQEQIRAHVAGSGRDIRIVMNDAYRTTNNIVSVQVARDHVPGGLLLLDGDLMFSAQALKPLWNVPGDATLLCHRIPVAQEEMKVRCQPDGRIVAIGKHLPPEDSYGESIGIARFSAKDARRLFHTIDRLVAAGATDVWYENAFQELINQGLPFFVADATGLDCLEIDTEEDLKTARKLVEKRQELSKSD